MKKLMLLMLQFFYKINSVLLLLTAVTANNHIHTAEKKHQYIKKDIRSKKQKRVL